MEESPEEILARLERYAARLRNGTAPAIPFKPVQQTLRAPAPPRPVAVPMQSPVPTLPHPYVAVAPNSPVAVGRVDDFIPPAAGMNGTPHADEHHGILRPLIETAAMLAGLLACVVAIVLYQRLDRDIASIIVAGLAGVGVYGMKEDVPLSGWVVLGLAIGAALGLLS